MSLLYDRNGEVRFVWVLIGMAVVLAIALVLSSI